MLKNIINYFGLESKNTTVKKELTAGALNFVSLSYILFLIPSLLRHAGMGYNAPFTALCVAAAVMCIAMGLIGNSPVPLTPVLSATLFFVFTAAVDLGLSWKQALTVVLIEGLLFIIITAFKVREIVAGAIPVQVKHAVYAGIGVYMVLLGLKWGGITVYNSKALVSLGNIGSPAVITAILGTLAILFLFIKNVKGSLILGSLITLLIAIIAGVFDLKGVVGLPSSMAPVFFQFDWPKSSQAADFIFAVVMLLLVHVFESPSASKQPGGMRTTITDSVASPAGAIFGMPNISGSVEGNPGGISAEGKTGMANVITGLLFLCALFFFPIVKLLGAAVALKSGALYPVAAPVLIVLGILMLQRLQKINLADISDSFPAILAFLTVAFTANIAHGIAFGVIAFPIAKAIQGKFREIPVTIYVLTALFLAYYIFFY